MKTFGDHLDQHREYEQEIAEFTYLTQKTHNARIIGYVDGTSIYLFEAKSPDGVLITSGWQGDEPAGWGASKILCQRFPNASFIPFVSPACFKSRQHRNDYGQNVDRKWPTPQSSEGKVLKGITKDLVRLGNRCFISLQEDPHRFISYYYGWGVGAEMDELITRKFKEHFPLTEEPRHAVHEGMFGGYMIDCGGRMAIQLETPGDGSYTISKRIDCQVDTASAIIKATAD